MLNSLVRKLFFFISFLVLNRIAIAQSPTAAFSANTRSGCATLVVNFKDLSTGDPKFWNWDFGNGQLSTLQNPRAVYREPGVYTVKLVVRNANGTDGITETNYITVSSSPVPNFSSDLRNGCLPSVIQFTDASTPAGNISSWLWDFGDGSTSTERNPSHIYEKTGFYSVALTVKNPEGCVGETRKGRYIRIVSGVSAEFSNVAATTCRPPFAIKFNNETSGPGNLTYSWDFGNGLSDVATNPTALYNVSGTFPVKLAAVSDFGCGDTITKNITIGSFATGFTAPDSVCINTRVDFKNTSSQIPKLVRWNFGDGTTSNSLNPSHTYRRTGSFSVKVINEYEECIDSAIKTITVVPRPTVSFTSSKTTSCKAPLTVNFRDATSNAGSWNWRFGDGKTSNQQNPDYTYTTEGEFDVLLTVKDIYGCENTLRRNDFIKIIPPTVEITDPNIGGCIPFNYQPFASATSIDGIASYSWNFGDGSPPQAGPFPVHLYPNTGTYKVKLTVTTNEGCIKSDSATVKTGTPVIPDFSFASDSVCASDTVRFTNLTPNANDYSYVWDFGDNNSSSLVHPKYVYKDTVDSFKVTLTAVNNGCATISDPAKVITIKPPISDFGFQLNCINGREVAFTNRSKTDPAYGPVNYTWNYGDGSAEFTGFQEKHIFPDAGSYTVSLKVTNGNCTQTITRRIRLTQEKADFQINKSSPICRNESVLISTINSDSTNILSYTWTIGNNSGSTSFQGNRSFSMPFTNNGTFDIALKIVDSNGCTNEKVYPALITVAGPTADFNREEGTCKDDIVEFDDLSSSPTPIIRWKWNFGDGITQDFSSGPFTHNYSDTGYFKVMLTVYDEKGCLDSASITNAVYITSPKALFSADTTLLCPGIPITLKDSSIGSGLKYHWDFGDGLSSDAKEPVHVFPMGDSTYSVKLIVTDASGCIDSLTKTNYIRIVSPKPGFTSKDTNSICLPLETKFFFAGTDFESFYWDFGDSTNISTLKDPNHFYNDYGSYTAKLYLIGHGGCIDSATQQVVISNPASSSFRYTPLLACTPSLVTFDLTAPPYTFYAVNFGDGTVDSTQNKTPTHSYITPGFYFPSLFLRDDVGCQVSIGGRNEIKVVGAQPLFSVDKKMFCDTGTVYFTNYTLNNDPIISTVWDFGDGTLSNEPSPTHRYITHGNYIPKLTVETQNGCVSSITDTVTIFQTPDATIVRPDTICFNAPVLFESSAAGIDSLISYNWIFGDGQSSRIKDPIIRFNKLGDIMVSLKTSIPFGCADSSTSTVNVVPLPTITPATNPTIIAGSSISLPVTYGGNIVNYNWAPAISLSCVDCPSPIAKPTKTTTYKINVTDNYGCSNAADITVYVICGEKNVFIPNTFSPNNDGNNDKFYPRGSGLFRIQSMRVFNRWGETVFQKINFTANDPSAGWDGMYKGKKADPDVYVYVIEVLCDNGEVFPMKGNVMLVK